MKQPTITITVDPIKGAQLDTNVPLEMSYLILIGTTNNVLMQLLAKKEDKRILAPV